MLRPNLVLANLIIFSASFLACRAGAFQGPEAALQHLPTASVEPDPASLALELDRAILVLKRGLKENWATRDQYFIAFEKTPSTDPTGRPVTDAKKYVECAIDAHLRTHQMWDEGAPIEVEVHRTIVEFTKRREGQAAGLQPLPCAVPSPRKVVLSAGMAASMLKTKIDLVYPAQALKNHVSGVVVIHATISTEGDAESLSVISGPALLRQAALDAVRHWTYRPYLLNNMPVEVETTINVVFAPGR